ncbi:hypothetical protein Tco_0716847 [Tanacetum coccineum]
MDSLIMVDKHLDAIPETESDEFIKSSVENLVQNPSVFEDFSDIESKRDVPDYDDSQTIIFSTFSNPLFDDSTSSDDEPSHGEVIHEMSFKTYSNPLFYLDEEINSSKFNPTHNEDLDSTPKDGRIDILHGPDDSIPPGIESDDFDSEDDDNSTSLPEFESFHVDYPDSGDSTIDVVEDIPVDMPNILVTDIQEKDKIEAKMTKLSTRTERT